MVWLDRIDYTLKNRGPAAKPAGLFLGGYPVIVILKPNPNPEQVNGFIQWLEGNGITVHKSVGLNQTVFGLVGDTASLDIGLISALDIVEDVKRVAEPYKNANRKFHPQDTVITVGNTTIGGGSLTMMAGPGAIESEEQLIRIAVYVKEHGATILRGGAFRPRTSPYSFKGLGAEALTYLKTAKEVTGLPTVTELMDMSQIPLFEDVDIIQIGPRNMQNFDLLKAVGRLEKPILLKRGLSATYEEWLMSAEYIMSEGNHQIILCERGIRTFETYTRNTLDLTCIPVLRKLTHLPIVIDPSHATGKYFLVPSMALAAVAAGCDGLEIEVHNDPQHAMGDGGRMLTLEKFGMLSGNLRELHAFISGRKKMEW